MRKTLKEISRTLRIPFSRYLAFRRLKEYHAQPRSLEETVDWAINFGRYGYFTIHTLQKRSEIIALARTVAALKPKIILEIGTARGGTLLIWSSLASQKVISCDLVHRAPQKPLFEALPPPGSACKVTLLTGNSHDAAFKQRVAQALNGQKADFVFIDGDHTESGVTADYNDYKEFVRPGGIIAFHDIVESQPLATNQVYHLWKKIKPKAVTEEFVNDPKQCGFGIGIIRIPQA
jgi:cephalosporin hydroxylase